MSPLKEVTPLSSSSTPLTLSSFFDGTIKHNFFKRSFDILFSLSAILLLAPLFIGIMLAIRLSSKGKSVYSHERIGRGGKIFRCFKFRTMYKDADPRLKELLAHDPELREEWDRTHKLRQDPRVTKVGAFLRKTSLDELPQFWNVLKGDMSVVGPRPVVQAEILKYFGPKAAKVFSIRPGLTGIWQVSGRSDTSYGRRILLDELYVDSRSFILDLKLIFKTIKIMFSCKGAY
jgi:exopolysaccharide production protein ExoY